MQCGTTKHPNILDFRREPLRLGGIGTADLGLFDFDIASDDVIIDIKNPSAWVDDYILEMWTPGNTVPFLIRIFRWALEARSTTTYTTSPHLWAVAQDDWHLHIEVPGRKLKQEARAGLGMHPTPSVRVATAVDSNEATLTEKQYVAGEPRPQRLHDGPIVADLEHCKTAAVKATSASNNSTSFAANCNVTLLLWCVVAKKGEAVERDLEDEDDGPTPQFIGTTRNRVAA